MFDREHGIMFLLTPERILNDPQCILLGNSLHNLIHFLSEVHSEPQNLCRASASCKILIYTLEIRAFLVCAYVQELNAAATLCRSGRNRRWRALCGEYKSESGSEVSAWQRKCKMRQALKKRHNKKTLSTPRRSKNTWVQLCDFKLVCQVICFYSHWLDICL